ncbi:T9SS type A sorting domain-containing protein [Dyadobacter luticola]|uniref:T9SS type A sorting domain-containing protein n=1 Tax=Dyadobacter luticola TaxID=1979387 RepID=A0A5R9KXK2_9BACT|nr:T9SS type A sorting domain-containing protein [Dyadobacter luticola]TLV00870.1 T9SS type A sorting domain-containing protein [Dyadobacter luticola]
MQTFYHSILTAAFFICSVFVANFASAQTTYLHQNFEKTTSLINPQPDSGQFSHVILTAPALSYYKFHKGYLELTRTKQDSATGGIIRVLRATPFEPNPETLIIQITLSAESIQGSAVNALYFYVGENFNPVNNSFPGNGLMFSKFAINFTENAWVVKDPETQTLSLPVTLKKPVTLTWVLNNSAEPLPYHLYQDNVEQIAEPATYDLWLDNEIVHKGSPAYPGNAAYSPTKLSNFEIRYRNGQGRIHIHEISIREGKSGIREEEHVVMPNPVSGKLFFVHAKNIELTSIRLTNQNGQNISVKASTLTEDKVQIQPQSTLAAGFYILSFLDKNKRKQSVRLVVE